MEMMKNSVHHNQTLIFYDALIAKLKIPLILSIHLDHANSESITDSLQCDVMNFSPIHWEKLRWQL